MAEKSQFHVYAGSKSLPLDWQPYDVMQSTETTFAGLELATQLISHHASIFLGVIILGMNKPRSWKMSVDQVEEAKEANQKLKYSNERTSESWRKVEATAIWDQACKRSSQEF